MLKLCAKKQTNKKYSQKSIRNYQENQKVCGSKCQPGFTSLKSTFGLAQYFLMEMFIVVSKLVRLMLKAIGHHNKPYLTILLTT